MKLQILSDLHLETEKFKAEPAPGAEVLVLAGDVDSRWRALAQFADWPVPVVFVPGNHEFDRRDVNEVLPQLRAHCEQLGLTMLERETCVLTGQDGRRIRFVGTTRWSDFDLFGPSQYHKALRAANYYVKVMKATIDGQAFDALAVRALALTCKDWLAQTLASASPASPGEQPAWHATVAITHYGPSLRSADPRYGAQASTASFCNADDDLLPLADLWIHGHLHCRHDYEVERPERDSPQRKTRVVSNARGHSHKGETEGFNGLLTVEV